MDLKNGNLIIQLSGPIKFGKRLENVSIFNKIHLNMNI